KPRRSSGSGSSASRAGGRWSRRAKGCGSARTRTRWSCSSITPGRWQSSNLGPARSLCPPRPHGDAVAPSARFRDNARNMSPPPHVLIVDDERDLVRLVEFNLQQAGFETAAAYGGEEALHKIRQRVPDLVVLDLMLPDIPGTEVCRQIKASPRTRESLLQDVWGVSSDLQTRTVDTHVKRLREKLGAGRDLIETVRGIGYRMVEPQR